jgi:8-amino-7-oxononanoate synthase
MTFHDELDALDRKGLLRSLRRRPTGTDRLLNFASNDYLALSGDARLKAGAVRAIEQYGCGATASRLMSGHLELHEHVERRLARLVRRPAALVFGSGFLTNIGVLGALARRGDVVLHDRLNHASLIDGTRLHGAALRRYRHCDPEHLDALLGKESASGRRIVVTESVFSMDGDRAPLAELSEVARRRGCLFVVDEAHAIGVFGGGLACDVDADVIVGTLGKALGGYGGFAAGSPDMRQLLVNRARSFIYSTALPPACLGSADAALDVLEESPQMGAELLRRAENLRGMLTSHRLALGASTTQIVPLIVGGNEATLALAESAREAGVLTVAVRPPTVPPGTARLRLSVTLAHTYADLARAAEALCPRE